MFVIRSCLGGKSWGNILPVRRGLPNPWAPTSQHRGLRTSHCVFKREDFFKDLDHKFVSFQKKFQENLPSTYWSLTPPPDNMTPETADVVIVGGGVIGWSVAYWLKQKENTREGMRVLVIEKDPTYTHSSTVLSAGGIRQQFSRPENIHMSLFAAQFLRNINEHLKLPNEDAIDLQFNPSGYLFLASEDGASVLEENYKVQSKEGAQVALLSAEQLKKKFPWICTDDVALASYGLENEGWFDPWTLLNAFKHKALSLGVLHSHGEVIALKQFVQEMVAEDGEVVNLRRITHVVSRLSNTLETQTVQCALLVNTAGAWSGSVAKMANIGTGPPNTLEGIKLPIEPRKRYVYAFHCPDGPGLDCPMLIDNSGAYFRREGLGGNYIGGMSPTEDEEPDASNLDVDYDFFQQKVWPLLARRVPAFERLKVKSAWAGYYDYNTYDHNGVIGNHPLISNMYIAAGFSGHGLQHSPAVGRAIAELIIDGEFKTLDLSAFAFNRFYTEDPVREINIV